MIILGDKYYVEEKDLVSVKSKVKEFQQIDMIDNSEKENIAYIIEIVKNQKPRYLVLNLELELSLRFQSLLTELEFLGVNIITFSKFSEIFLHKKAPINRLNFVLQKAITGRKSQNIFKRVFDICFSLGAITIVLVPMFVIAILIKIKSPKGPIIFTQLRMGKNKKFFRVYKFRTMINDAENVLDRWLNDHPEIKEEYEKDFKLKNDPRIIPIVGSFLRKSSLDELPQFFNSLGGSMSVVGPRPIVENEIEKYGKYADKLFSVKPGVTGLWQVSGRNDIDYDDRVALDMKYIDEKSLIQDIKIIFETIKVMILRKGAY
ncbi:MAG: Undecaprenyl-phosphate galactosephosphotransferase (EC [uncultured Campylobacterales bacterium]|uniref:Undecaprenyl-phosphate galactosephosphotransferase (EC) n=1 Tax=uncultured Campylobacterales bacterium TaxID=352960 RepID=A0A6S6T4G9_9BACT|nr:MAG: Undecaprenyl-phosphate galactosephosphotransferase (EC [uncultured Campylobacterales bacterium]